MSKFKKRISVLLTAALMLSVFNGWSVYAGALGDKLYGKSVIIGEEAALANGVYWNAGYTEKITENYIEYSPGGSVVPIISHGNDVHGAASFKTVAARAAMEGKTVVAGINGDFFTMSNGVPDGVTIKDGLLITSESSKRPSVGFYPDGRVIIGRSNLNIRADGPNLGTGIGAIHLNKAVSKVSGVMLYTRVYGNDHTNKASIPTYNVLLNVDTEDFRINGAVEGVVEKVFSAVGSSEIPEGRVLLSIAAATDYPGTLTKLSTLIPGDTLTLTFAADQAWDNISFAIGAGDKIVSDGKNVASTNNEIHPRTAIGLTADGRAIFYTLDGRKTGHSKGATLSQLANRLIELGCTEAVNMDGGGSTAIHGVYPGDTSLNTINIPSEGSLRNCANYILLVNTAAPTGQLWNLHLYPYNPRMLAGATQKFTVKGTDTNYYPINVYLPLSYDAPESIGTFDEEGNFTAGSEGGKGEIRVFADGGISGSTEVEIISKPDSISILNQSDNKVVTSININEGSKIDLTASSTYLRLPLYSTDKSYTWTVEGGIGTIDGNGLFTASDVSGGSGTIKASAGGTVASVNVNIVSLNDKEPPTIEMSRKGQELTAIIKDVIDTELSAEKIKLTFDGEALEFTYDRDNKTLTANLPALDGAMHRVVIRATDKSGNISRKGLTIPRTASQDSVFVDMEGHWAIENTIYLYGQGVVNGVETEGGLMYNPDKSITRAEFAVLMKNWLAGQAKGYENVTLPFIDAAAIPSWSLDSVKAMYGMGIIAGTGTENGLVFNPQGSITRQEVMTIIGRTQEKGYGESDLSQFTDKAHISLWALPYVKTLVKQEVVSGNGGRIWPGNPITRAEVATIITNLY